MYKWILPSTIWSNKKQNHHSCGAEETGETLMSGETLDGTSAQSRCFLDWNWTAYPLYYFSWDWKVWRSSNSCDRTIPVRDRWTCIPPHESTSWRKQRAFRQRISPKRIFPPRIMVRSTLFLKFFFSGIQVVSVVDPFFGFLTFPLFWVGLRLFLCCAAGGEEGPERRVSENK